MSSTGVDFGDLPASLPERGGVVLIPDNGLPEYEIRRAVEKINTKTDAPALLH
jgi:hypothetical protein